MLPSLALTALLTFSGETQRRIEAVESGLLPAVQLTNQPPDRRSILGEMAKMHVTAVSIAVIHGGKLDWAKGYGIGGTVVTPSTLFQAASISKSLTAMAALNLVQQGKIGLDAPIETALRSWTLPANTFTAQHPVTLRGLLSHTAGITVSGFEGYSAGQPVPTLRQVLDGEKPANSAPVIVKTVPGQQYNYSGGGYTIVQQAILDATGLTYPEFMRTTVLRPLKMAQSTFEQPLNPDWLKRAALPVDAEGKPLAGGPNTYPEMAPAGLWTTSSDLAKWVIEMQKSLAGKANHVLSAETTRLMLTAVREDYGLGAEVHKTGRPSFAHTGANVGYQSYYFSYEDGDGAVILTNSNNSQNLISEILRGLAHEYRWPDFPQTQRTAIDVPIAEVLPFTGKFSAKGAFDFSINADGDHLVFAPPFGPSQPLLNSSKTSFFVLAGTLQMTFETPDRGVLSFGEQKVPFERMK